MCLLLRPLAAWRAVKASCAPCAGAHPLKTQQLAPGRSTSRCQLCRSCGLASGAVGAPWHANVLGDLPGPPAACLCLHDASLRCPRGSAVLPDLRRLLGGVGDGLLCHRGRRVPALVSPLLCAKSGPQECPPRGQRMCGAGRFGAANTCSQVQSTGAVVGAAKTQQVQSTGADSACSPSLPRPAALWRTAWSARTSTARARGATPTWWGRRAAACRLPCMLCWLLQSGTCCQRDC